MDLAQLVELGGKLDLADPELQALVREEQEAARAARAKEKEVAAKPLNFRLLVRRLP